MNPSLTPAITPHSKLRLVSSADAPALDAAVAERLTQAFARGAGHGLLQLGAAEVDTVLPPAFAYLRELGQRYVTALCTQATDDARAKTVEVPTPAPEELEALVAAAPPMPGAEYLHPAVLGELWRDLDAAFALELKASKGTREAFLQQQHRAWHTVGRVHFNLAENRKDEEAPFAFLATYTAQLSAQGKAQHLPLGRALEEYAGKAKQAQLLALLLPVQRAAERCAWLRDMLEAGELYHPLRWTAPEAYRLLQDVPALEAAGVVVRVPGAWSARRPPRPRVSLEVGKRPPSKLGMEALLDFQVAVSLEGEPLTPAELKILLSGTEGLALIRGRWVEVQPDTLRALLDDFRALEAASDGGLGFAEAMRLLSGATSRSAADADTDGAGREWSSVVAGDWLAQTLRTLRAPEQLVAVHPGAELHATLRPYQEVGVRWLHLLMQLGLGACLADDMGLGKTIQVLALLLVLRQERRPGGRGGKQTQPPRASLLVAPASLLANWASELACFAPSLAAQVVHPSELDAAAMRALDSEALGKLDLVITSYGTLLRTPALTAASWRLVVLDEAQAIKNPGAKQTRAVKALQARSRIALTGTPVENRLGDLWSLFDFLNPGLLGSSKEFGALTKRLGSGPHPSYGPLRELVRPYILRRLKSDKSVIAELPDKTEQRAFCLLTKKQAALYEQAVSELARQLARVEGIQRKGVVLATLMRMKQICNHPSHWLGDGDWREADSGKLQRLRELAEVIADKQEKALVFTQFREATAPLASFLGGVFGRAGLVLHGDTPVKERKHLVARFQEDESVPFFVLSLKAGGTGLNLTAASHVIHFDRWWNPAVENQATDRAFRIGQTRNVLVHKFVCRGTVEEKVDALIEDKRKLSADLLDGGGEPLLTELDDAALLKLVSLDIRSALAES